MILFNILKLILLKNYLMELFVGNTTNYMLLFLFINYIIKNIIFNKC